MLYSELTLHQKVFPAHIAILSPVFNIDITVDHIQAFVSRYYLSTFFGLIPNINHTYIILQYALCLADLR